MNFEDKSVNELREMLNSHQITSKELTEYFINKIKKENKDLNTVVEIFDDAIICAEEADKKINEGKSSSLLGIPVLIADNINYKGKTMTCGAKFLDKYVAVYNADIIEKLLKEGCIILGRTNVGEFGIDNSTKSSIYGVSHNALDINKVAGCGAAGAIKAGFAPIGIDADPRIGASYNGIVGLKPTNGRISRFGVFTTLLDQVGIVAKNSEDIDLMLNVLSGKSNNDEKSIDEKEYNAKKLNNENKYKIGISKDIINSIKDSVLKQKFNNFILWLKDRGNEVVDLDCSDFKYALPTYHILESSEISSNLDKFDGVKYTARDNDIKNVYDLYTITRSKNFDESAKMEIMLGNFVISNNNFKDYFDKAKLIQSKLIMQKNDMFTKCDLLLMPTTLHSALDINASNASLLQDYQENYFTSFANLVGIPSMTIPFDEDDNRMPFGLQIVAENFNENKIIDFAKFVKEGWRK